MVAEPRYTLWFESTGLRAARSATVAELYTTVMAGAVSIEKPASVAPAGFFFVECEFAAHRLRLALPLRLVTPSKLKPRLGSCLSSVTLALNVPPPVFLNPLMALVIPSSSSFLI